MEFLSACHFRRGENRVSLLLQQYRYGRAQVLFACLCAGEGENAVRAGSYMTEQLLQWFRGLRLKKLFRNQEKSINRLAEDLHGVIRWIDRELAYSGLAVEGGEVALAGIFCLDDRYLMLHRGVGRICLVNTAFGRAHSQFVGRESGEQGMRMEQGILQPEIALLFSAEAFYEYVTEDMVKEGLAVGEVATEEQMGRHLGELAREGERRGATDMSALLLRTR